MGSAFNSLNAQQIWKNLNSWKTLNALQTTNRHEVNLCLTITYSLLLKGDHFDSKFDGWRHSLSSDQCTFSLSHRSKNLKKKNEKLISGHETLQIRKSKKKHISGHETLRNISLLEVCCNISEVCRKMAERPLSFLGKRGHQEFMEGMAMLTNGKLRFDAFTMITIQRSSSDSPPRQRPAPRAWW